MQGRRPTYQLFTLNSWCLREVLVTDDRKLRSIFLQFNTNSIVAIQSNFLPTKTHQRQYEMIKLISKHVTKEKTNLEPKYMFNLQG